MVLYSICTTFELHSKVLTFEKSQIIWIFTHLFVPLQAEMIRFMRKMVGLHWWNRILPMLFAFYLSLLTADAEIRIMLISDPHVMGPGLLISEGEAWDNVVKYDRKLNQYSRAIFDETIAIALREKPDIFLISGDLTKDGELLSHQYVVKKLQELKAAGIKALVIPGNHDMGTLNAFYYDGIEMYEAEVINTSQFAEMYKDFGYGDDVQRDPTSLTWCCEPVDGLVIIGIDTGHDNDPLNGTVSSPTLDWVCERAQEATEAGKRVIVMMHHMLFPHVTNAEKFSSSYAVKLSLKNNEGAYFYLSYRYVRDYLANAGVGVVLSGHVHASDIAKDANADLTRTIHDICTASCDAYPNPYRILTLNDDGTTMGIRTRYITELPGVDDFYAKSEQQIEDGLMTLVYEKTFHKDFSKLFAEIFKIHVAGNEPANPKHDEYLKMYEESLPQLKEDAQIKDFLDAYSVTFDELNQMIFSLLEDRSNYGDAERESLDDDLNTTIPIFGDGWTGIRSREIGKDVVGKEAAGESGWFTLQGVRITKPEHKGIYIYKDNNGTKLTLKR